MKRPDVLAALALLQVPGLAGPEECTSSLTRPDPVRAALSVVASITARDGAVRATRPEAKDELLVAGPLVAGAGVEVASRPRPTPGA